jgi:hypothetical protein
MKIKEMREKSEFIDVMEKLNQDMKKAATELTQDETRYFVDIYYQVQKFRIRAEAQIRAAEESGEPSKLLMWMFLQFHTLEIEIKKMLKAYADSHPVGIWSQEQVGIGPVISAGLLAHIDITKAPTAGHIWSFAGLNPTKIWNKKEKRPWNADLKTLCVYKAGECFVKTCNHKDSFYGRLYAEKKVELIKENEALAFQEVALEKARKVGKSTDAYKYYSVGQLPPAHIHARARRWAVKLFLSHWHEVAYEAHYGKFAPVPYILEHGGHTHRIVRNMEA